MPNVGRRTRPLRALSGEVGAGSPRPQAELGGGSEAPTPAAYGEWQGQDGV